MKRSTQFSCLSLRLLLTLAAVVIASDAGGNTEVVLDGRTGRLFPKGDHAALADRVVELVRDRDKARALAEEGRRRVIDAYGVDTLVRRHEKFYEDLIDGGIVSAGQGEPSGRRTA